VLHPKKGEGEHSKKYNKRRKAPQIALTVLIFSTPFCMAQSALATTSFGLSGLQQPPVQQQKVLGTQGHNYQLQNRQTRYSSLTPIISEADITALESTLSQYKTKLAQLTKKDLLDPALKPQLDRAIQSLNTQISALEAQIATAKADLTAYNKAKQTLSKALTDYSSAQQETVEIKARFSTATATYEEKAQATRDAQALADASLTTLNLVKQDTLVKREALSSADASLTTQLEITNNALITFNNAKLLTAQATESLETAQSNLNQAQQELDTATTNKAEAQNNYDTNLIPDPDWIAPTYQKENTRLVPYTEIQIVKTLVPTTTTRIDTQTIPNILFNSELNNTEGWSGVNAGWQGSSPALIDNQITFSYTNQTVSQGLFSGPFQNATLTLSADWSNNDLNRGFVDTYSMTVEARDINQNPVGTATYNSTGSHGWDNKSVTLQATGPVSYITVSFTGLDAGFWYGIYGPTFKNPSLSISHGQEITETTYEEVITYEEVTKYREEIYYTTEPVLIEGTIQVKINEGGQATFNAPAGATFTGSNLRYESINNPTCGRDIAPVVDGLTSVTIQALNSVWGDPCGGQYKHITGTLTYLGQPTAPLIKDPALLVELNNAISVYDLALSNKSQKQELYNLAQEDLDTLQEKHNDAQTSYEEAVSQQENLEAAKAGAGNNLSNALEQEGLAETEHNSKTSALTSAQAEEALASQNLATEEGNLQVAVEDESVALATKTQAEASLEEATSALETKVNTDISFTDLETILDTPKEEGSTEIPAVIENLMDVDLNAVDPTELTEEQATQLVEAALVAFETAEEGSPEYEQALEALYLAAEQDDIELPEELAAIPGLAGAVEVLNFLGNAGADMSPKVREESEKIVVTAVVAAGVAVQAAAGAATSAAVSAGGSTGSSGSRRIGK
jgi:hypothetical protein